MVRNLIGLLIATLLLLGWWGDGVCGTMGKIAGQVTDTAGNPLPGVNVVVENTDRGVRTDREGVYFLLSVEPGKYTLVASMTGYAPQRAEDVHVTSDFTTNQPFVLAVTESGFGFWVWVLVLGAIAAVFLWWFVRRTPPEK